MESALSSSLPALFGQSLLIGLSIAAPVARLGLWRLGQRVL